MQTTIPEAGYLRLKQIVGDRTANPPIPAIIPIGKSSWWLGVKTGRYPQPVKLGPRTTVWRASDIQQLVDNPEPQKK
jgi:prophage regulatory protein